MRSTAKAITHVCLLVTVLVAWSPIVVAQGGQSPIYYFGEYASHAVNPMSKVVFDGNRNLYGATTLGGTGCSSGCGTLYELTPQGEGTWVLSNYYDFKGGADGALPWAPVTIDTAGNIYGTTASDGSHGWGTVFELTSGQSGGSKFHVLYNFNKDDSVYGQLGIDKSGDVFGVTVYGKIFALIPGPNGWKYKVLTSLPGSLSPAVNAGLLVGKGGLYGTSVYGGTGICKDGFGNNLGCGFVFQVTEKNGVWTASVIYNFKGAPNDGAQPYGGLVSDAQGNRYSTTHFGGNGPCVLSPPGCGTLFKLSSSNGVWKDQILHHFVDGPTDGSLPTAEPIFDSFHELIGTADAGGTDGCGLIYKWAPSAPNWTIVSNFHYNDGCNPMSPLTFGSFGFLYGTSYVGGLFDLGTVFTLVR